MQVLQAIFGDVETSIQKPGLVTDQTQTKGNPIFAEILLPGQADTVSEFTVDITPVDEESTFHQTSPMGPPDKSGSLRDRVGHLFVGSTVHTVSDEVTVAIPDRSDDEPSPAMLLSGLQEDITLPDGADGVEKGTRAAPLADAFDSPRSSPGQASALERIPDPEAPGQAPRLVSDSVVSPTAIEAAASQTGRGEEVEASVLVRDKIATGPAVVPEASGLSQNSVVKAPTAVALERHQPDIAPLPDAPRSEQSQHVPNPPASGDLPLRATRKFERNHVERPVDLNGAQGREAHQPAVPKSAVVQAVTFRQPTASTADVAQLREPTFADPIAGVPAEMEDVQRQRAQTPPKLEPLARPIIGQVVQVIARSNLDGLIEVRLQPEELGRVKLAMSQAEIGVIVHITADRHETLDLMRRNIDMLAEDLRREGFENLSFSFDQNGQQSDFEGDSDVEQAPRDIGDGIRAEVRTNSPRIENGRLDIRL